MKSKLGIFFLIVLVVGIWSKVFFKFKENANSTAAIAIVELADKEVFRVNVKDTVTLKLDYQDPFRIEEKSKEVVEEHLSNYSEAYQDKQKPEVIRPVVKYLGRIRKSESKGALGIIHINGEVLYVRKNEYVEGYKIVELEREYISLKDRAGVQLYYRD